MTINITRHYSTHNVMQHPNVQPGPSFKKLDRSKLHTQVQMYEIVDYFLTAQPNWRFIAQAAIISPNNSLERVVHSFDFLDGDEKIGNVNIAYQGRSSEYKIVVNNDRIEGKRQRGSGYKTTDPQKAIKAIRKNFFRLGATERVAKAAELAERLVETEYQEKSWDVARKKANLLTDSEEFVFANLPLYLQEHPQRVQDKGKLDTAREALMVVEQVKRALDNKKCIVVVLEGDEYIVMRDGSTTAVYNNDTLPYDLREKIGLLKLVNDHQMISDVGCRVQADAFVLLPGEGEA